MSSLIRMEGDSQMVVYGKKLFKQPIIATTSK
jgi:hypothetical protein